MSRPRTRTGEAYENAVHDEADLNTPDMVRAYSSEPSKGVVDSYALSVEDRAELGDHTGALRDNEVVIYPVRDEVAGRRRFAEIRRKYGAARQLRYISGAMKGEDPCGHMDVQMVAVPREAMEALERQRKEAGDAYIRQFKPGRKQGEYEKHDEILDRSEESLRAQADRNAEMFEQMGIGENGPTRGMSLEDGLAYYERQGYDIERLEAEARRGGRHSADNLANWKKILQDDGRAGRGKTVVSGFGKNVNPNSALGQVQQRNARAQSAGR